MVVPTKGCKAIFFDLDGTLRHTVPLGSDIFTEKAIELGLPISDEKQRETGRWEHYYWAQSSELMRDTAKFKDDQNDHAFWNNYAQLRLEKLGATPEQIETFYPLINKHMMNEYDPKNWVPPELFEVLPALRIAGYTLAVLSNRRSPFMETMVELSLDQYFDQIMAAGDIGSWKPDPKVFDQLLAEFNLAPEETIYIGDNYYADVVGARNAGLIPILYDPRGIFPDADCTRITSFTELADILQS